MQLPKKLNVTDQTIDISALTEAQLGYYERLAKDLEERYVELGEGRQIFTLSGPPGSGKSVVSAILNHIYTKNSLFTFVNVGMDAFHFSNSILAEKKLLDVKGRYDTYDTEQLLTKMTAFKNGGAVSFPYYSREDHNPIADHLSVDGKNILLMLEGQWLLRKAPEWDPIRELSPYNLFVSGSTDDMRENVIRRHIAGGRTPKDAMNFFAQNDLQNTKEVLENSANPDKKLLFYKDI